MADEQLKCPKCRTEPLHAPVGSREDAPLQCAKCKGLWFSQSDAAHLVQGTDVVDIGEAKEHDNPPPELDARVGMCPRGHAILTRAKVEIDHPFHLDRCHKCGGIWFDEGEWARLASRHMLNVLNDLWKPVWRRQIVQHRELEEATEELKSKLGDELFGEVDALAHRLRESRHADEALDYLRKHISVHVVDGDGGENEPEPPDDVA